MEGQTEQKPARKILIFAGVAMVFVVVGGVVIYALMGSGNQPAPASSTTSPEPWPRVATKEQVSQSLSELDASLKQAAKDQAAAKAALKDSENQVKVGN